MPKKVHNPFKNGYDCKFRLNYIYSPGVSGAVSLLSGALGLPGPVLKERAGEEVNGGPATGSGQITEGTAVVIGGGEVECDSRDLGEGTAARARDNTRGRWCMCRDEGAAGGAKWSRLRPRVHPLSTLS